MNNIKMIPIGELFHHPENPRKDLGDLTELAESIKQNGVMQNLTVVPGHRMEKEEWIRMAMAEGVDKVSAAASYNSENAEVSTGYTVVIGNRRMEAAKMAGLEELPCVVSTMDHKAQISTMLMENMQRQDLTVYEQAQGFQMMMDLGFTTAEIGEKTGFSEKTVKERIKFTKFNQKNFEGAVSRGATLLDMIEISKLESKSDQNKALADAGTNNFRRTIKNLLGEQLFQKNEAKLHKLAKETTIKKIPEDAKIYGGGQYTWLNYKIDSGDKDDKILKTLRKAEKENPEEELFYKLGRNWNDDAATMSILKKNKKQAPADETEQQKEFREYERKRQRKLRAVKKLWAEAYRLRLDFIREYSVGVNGTGMTMIGKLMIKYAMTQKRPYGQETLPENQHWKGKYIREAVGLPRAEECAEKPSLWALMEEKDIPQIRMAIAWIMGGGVFDCDSPESGVYDGTTGDYSERSYMGNMIMERYEFLKEIGYELSDMEAQLLDGTHPAYGEEAGA